MYGVFQRLDCYEQNLQGLELWTQESSYYSVGVQQDSPNPTNVLTPIWWDVIRSLPTLCAVIFGLSSRIRKPKYLS